MINKTQVQVVVVVVILVFAAGIVATGGSPNPAWLKFYSYAVTAAVVVLAVWDRWLWRLRWLQKVFKTIPRDIRGTWEGTLESQWIDPETKSTAPQKAAYLVVRQRWSKVSLKLFTDEMTSDSTLANVAAADDHCTVDYIYLSRPRSNVEDRSRMHPGTASLEVSGTPVIRLYGRYWTDRKTRGELDFRNRNPALADDYESAVKLFV